MNPMLITARLSSTYTGDHPMADWCTSSPSMPSILGAEGPQMSMSSSPTSLPAAASANASCAAKVLLPTPPLPESTRTLCLMVERRSAIATRSVGVGGFGFGWGVGLDGLLLGGAAVWCRHLNPCNTKHTWVGAFGRRGADFLVGAAGTCGRLAGLLTRDARAVCVHLYVWIRGVRW